MEVCNAFDSENGVGSTFKVVTDFNDDDNDDGDGGDEVFNDNHDDDDDNPDGDIVDFNDEIDDNFVVVVAVVDEVVTVFPS